MKLTSFPLAIAILVLLFGGIGFSTSMNWWQTESNKVPAKYSTGEAAGEYNPADIRGSYTFGAIHDSFGIPLEDLQIAFHLPAGGDTAAFAVKSLETINADLPVEMGTSAVRLFTAFYKGLPYDLSGSEESYLFAEAAQVLLEKGNMTAEQKEYLTTHTLSADLQPPTGSAPVAEPSAQDMPNAQTEPQTDSAAAAEHSPEEMTITGKTTFQNLLDWGMTPDSITSVLGEAMPEPGVLIKDYVSSKGLEFSTMKGQFQAELDKLK